MTNDTQPFPPVSGFRQSGALAAQVAADARRAVRRYRQRRALVLLGAAVYAILCVLAILAQPGILLIPGLIVFGAGCAGAVQLARRYRIARYRRN